MPVRIYNPGFKDEHYDTDALVDTGCAASAIPDYIATDLAHRVTDVPAIEGYGVTGDIDIYLHTFRIEIFAVEPNGHVDYNDIVHTIHDRKIGVVEGLKYVLLGVEDFLGDFKLFVDYPARIFSVTR